jgi:hypothetical protein
MLPNTFLLFDAAADGFDPMGKVRQLGAFGEPSFMFHFPLFGLAIDFLGKIKQRRRATNSP